MGITLRRLPIQYTKEPHSMRTALVIARRELFGVFYFRQIAYMV
jgi:hypothetical protein